MKLLQRIIISSIFLLVVLLLVVQNHTASGAVSRFSLIAATSTSSDTASTSIDYMDASTSKSTTTLQIATGNTDHIDLNIQYNASSTNSTLQYTIEHADQQDPHFGDWFCEGGTSSTATGSTTVTTFGAKCPIYQWTPGKSGISRRSIPLTDLGTRFMRIRFSSKDGNGSIWAEPIQRQPN